MQKISLLFRNYPRWTAVLAGALSSTGFEPLGLWPLTLICFALFIHLVAQVETAKRAAFLGWLFGVGHFAISNNWIAVAFTFQAAMPIWLGYIAVVALALYLAVYPALAAWGAWWLSKTIAEKSRHSRERGSPATLPSDKKRDWASPPLAPRFRGNDEARGGVRLPLIVAFAGCWIVTEWLRSWIFTGYVWNPLAVIAADGGWLAKPAAYVGTYGFSGIIILVTGLTILFVRHIIVELKKKPLTLGRVAFVIAFFVLPEAIAVAVLPYFISSSPPRLSSTRLTIVQPNISQADKYAPGYDAINFAKLATYSRPLAFARLEQNRPATQTFKQAMDAMRSAAKEASGSPRLLLWPEAAIPDYLEDGYPYRYYQDQPGESAVGARERLTTLMGNGDVLITGANRLVIDKGQLVAARNSVSAMDANGNLLGHYDKAHLVPYGEYLPLPWLLHPLGLARLVPGNLDFWPGPGPQTMTVRVGGKPVKVGFQICYEIIFSGQVVDRRNRPDFIFNPSNDAWFGTIGPPQFLAQARLRAIEEGLPVVRATPTGISAVIDADGRIVESLPLGTAGRIDAWLPVAKTPTLFARLGNIAPLGFAALLIALAFLPLARRRPTR